MHLSTFESSPKRLLTPLDIQELLDHCIAYLSGSSSDLKVCALVARSWVRVAQSCLFRAPNFIYNPFNPTASYRRLHDIFQNSPHLICTSAGLNYGSTISPSPQSSHSVSCPFQSWRVCRSSGTPHK
ncbi:hypothetical protein B0H19DRAFT_312796 [Mycena capillaripes]|nr:hypothetical protein B0H19DRAFT_312796 [Mycena capillaripes]